MTERLYETDAYCREFTATVVSCEPQGDAFCVVLDRSAFFPEGGGQAADTGRLGGAAVLDVQLDGESVLHTTDAPLTVGETVSGILDWELRFSRMQAHAGEHIVSGVVHTLYGYDNVGFHMSDTGMTVDFNGPLTQEDIDRVELAANRAIYQNLPIVASYPTKAELADISYRSKIEPREGIRLISIGEVDCCACCAPHPAATGEIGVIKILDFCPNKGGTRVEMLAGTHALTDYAALNATNKALMGLLSAPRGEVKELAFKLASEAQTLRAENQRLAKRLALAELRPVWVGASAYAVTEGLSYDELRHCSNALLEGGAASCVLLSRAENGDYLYVISSREADIRGIVKTLNDAFDGKGGGKPNYAQGKLSAAPEADILSKIEELLR